MFVPTLLGVDLSALSVATSVHECFGIKSHAFGRYRCGISFFSTLIKTHVHDRLLEPRVAREVLIAFAKKQKKPCLLIPTNDWYLDLAIRLRRDLEPYYRLSVPNRDLYRQIAFKEQFYALLDDFRILHPPTVAFSIGEDPDWDVFPCVLKPSSSVEAQKRSFLGQKKVYVIVDRVELRQTINNIRSHQKGMRYLLQPYIEADKSFVLSVFCQENFGTRRACLAEVAAEERGDSSRGNYSALLVRELNDISRRLIAFCDGIGYEGIANFDIIRHGKIDYVLEMNPRMGRSSDYLRGAGHSLSDFLFKSQNRSTPYPENFSSVPIYWRCVRDKTVLAIAREEQREEIREKIKMNFAFSPFAYAERKIRPIESLYRFVHLERRGRALEREQKS